MKLKSVNVRLWVFHQTIKNVELRKVHDCICAVVLYIVAGATVDVGTAPSRF